MQQSFRADVTTFYTYVDQVPWRGYELHVGRRSYAGVFPPTTARRPSGCAGPRHCRATYAGPGRTAPRPCWTPSPPPRPPWDERLRSGRVVSRVRGIVDPPNYVRQAYGAGWALVGDAGYHRDPMTGHGITDAFRDAELLADALHVALADPVARRPRSGATSDDATTRSPTCSR